MTKFQYLLSSILLLLTALPAGAQPPKRSAVPDRRSSRPAAMKQTDEKRSTSPPSVSRNPKNPVPPLTANPSPNPPRIPAIPGRFATGTDLPDPTPPGPLNPAPRGLATQPDRPVGPGAAQPGGVISNIVLANTYRGSDGGAYYVRKLQNKVYFFGEHPGKKYAVVFEGTLNGINISGSYWDLPKGTRTLKGSMQLRIEQNGNRLTVQNSTGGVDLTSLTTIVLSNDQLPTAIRPPGFYAANAADLDGAWRRSEDSIYIREVDSRVIGWQESHFASGQKPALARILFGTRNGGQNNSVAVVAIEMPKGQSLGQTNHTMIVDDAWHFRILGGSKWYRDIFSLPKLATELESQFDDNCVGYGYAIAHEGKVIRTGGGGCRLLAADGGPLPFDGDTQKCTQSSAKTITAAAIMQLLESRGMSVDDPIIHWLPHYWSKCENVASLTFKHLLSHKSGLRDYGDPDEFESLRQTIETGPVDMNWIVPQFTYRNANYALFRLIIPYLDKPADMMNFEDNGLTGATLNKKCSERFLAYVQDHILQPAGLSPRHAWYSSDNRAYSYNFLSQGVAGYPQQEGQMYEMGAGGWVVSARDYVLFLAALENGVILPKDKATLMKNQGLGLFSINTAIGRGFGHGGSLGGGTDGAYGSGREGRAQSLILPNNVQVFVTINSANNNEPAESSNARFGALRDAFEASMHPQGN